MMKPYLDATTGASLTPAKQQQAFHKCLEALLLAGEESNGMTSRAHTPDKDGLWGALLTLQMCAVTGKTLRELNTELWDAYGKLVSVRWDVEAPEEAKRGLVDFLLDTCTDFDPETDNPFPHYLKPTYCGGSRGESVEVIFADRKGERSYLAVRASGTENMNRVYVEAPEEEERDAILHMVVQELARLIGTSSECLLEKNPIYGDRWRP
jgi:phosphomannomutase